LAVSEGLGLLAQFRISPSHVCDVSVYGSLLRMQNTAWGNVVDEEQDIRNGSKSSRSHRPFKFLNQLFLASTNARHFPPFLRSNTCDDYVTDTVHTYKIESGGYRAGATRRWILEEDAKLTTLLQLRIPRKSGVRSTRQIGLQLPTYFRVEQKSSTS
jgi:hypothetical protein